MNRQIINRKYTWLAGMAVLTLVIGLAAGCKKQQPAEQAVRTDQQIANDVQAKIQGESALAGQNIQVSVSNGVTTLSGTVADDASRALAGNDSGSVDGVKTVVNNLTVQPKQAAAEPAPPPSSAPMREPYARQSRPRQQPAGMMPPQQSAPAPQQSQMQAPAPPPARPTQPEVKLVTLVAGTMLPIRTTDAMDTKTIQTNDVFHASVAQDVLVNGIVAIPRGSPVLGRVVEAREAAHFKGSSFLAIQLTQLTVRGHKVTVDTDTFSKEGTARGKNTAVKAGGGAVVGALIGALAGGGKGAAIGAVAGGGAGAGINAATRGEQVQIPTETMLNFTLQSPVTVSLTPAPSGSGPDDTTGDPQLQHR